VNRIRAGGLSFEAVPTKRRYSRPFNRWVLTSSCLYGYARDTGPGQCSLHFDGP
jgi:hypothetical protein